MTITSLSSASATTKRSTSAVPLLMPAPKSSPQNVSHTREAIHTVSSYLPTLTPVPNATMTLQQFKEQLTNLVHDLVDVPGAKS